MQEMKDQEWYRLNSIFQGIIDDHYRIAIELSISRCLSDIEINNLQVAIKDYMDSVPDEETA